MARITVEECMNIVPNRFDLVVLAAQRARQLNGGADATLPLSDDKATVLALREIGSNTVSVDDLMKEVVANIDAKRNGKAISEDVQDSFIDNGGVEEFGDEDEEEDPDGEEVEVVSGHE